MLHVIAHGYNIVLKRSIIATKIGTVLKGTIVQTNARISFSRWGDVTVCHSHAATGKRRTRWNMSRVYRTLRALRTASD
jgi:hypothetical protein